MIQNQQNPQFTPPRSFVLPANCVPTPSHQGQQATLHVSSITLPAAKGDARSFPMKSNIPTFIDSYECSSQAPTSSADINRNLNSSEIKFSSSVLLTPSSTSSSPSPSSLSFPFFQKRHNQSGFNKLASAPTQSLCSFPNTNMSQITTSTTDSYKHAHRDERTLTYTNIDDYNNNNNCSINYSGSNDSAFGKNYHTLTELKSSPLLRSVDVKFNPTDFDCRRNRSCIGSSNNSHLTNFGKLPAFSDLTSQLRHSMSPDDDWIAECSTLDSDVSMTSPPNSRSSSCSTNFDEEEDRTPHLVDLNLVNFDIEESFRGLDETFLSDVSVMDHPLIKTEPIDTYYADDAAMTPMVTSDFNFPSSDILSEFSDSEGYDSSYEQAGCSTLPAHCYYQVSGYSASSAEFQQTSPETDEGFVDEPNVPENLPNFEKIQFSTIPNEERPPPSRRSTPESPKIRRKAPGSPQQMTEKERRKPGRKPGQVSNVLHLWEFMRDLLHSPDSKGIIEWISKPEGVFRVVNSTEVAKLWGKKKKNKKEMTYEKLSRSLRYSRLEGYFSNLPKDKNYPKKLCFKFGPKSRDWH